MLGKLPVPGRPTNLDYSRAKGPIVLAVGAGGSCLDSFSSPEHEVLMVSYCDQSLSVVRLSTLCFKLLLLQNG